MSRKPLFLGVGALLLVVGFIVLALGGGDAYTGVGTTAGLAGLVLIGWALLLRAEEEED